MGIVDDDRLVAVAARINHPSHDSRGVTYGLHCPIPRWVCFPYLKEPPPHALDLPARLAVGDIQLQLPAATLAQYATTLQPVTLPTEAVEQRDVKAIGACPPPGRQQQLESTKGRAAAAAQQQQQAQAQANANALAASLPPPTTGPYAGASAWGRSIRASTPCLRMP